MKIFRYILVPLCLTLMSSHAHSQSFTAYDLNTPGYLGNTNFGGNVGMAFDVNAVNVTVTSLGIFDSGGDGFHHVMTTYLFDRDTHALIASQNFSGTTVLTAGTLVGNQRFITLSAPVVLGPGHYVVSAYGFLNDGLGNDRVGAEDRPGFVQDTFNDGGGVITAVGPSLYSEAYLGPGVYPTNTLGDALAFNAGSFQLFVPEPSTVALMFSLVGVGGSLALKRARRRGTKKRA
ncbi:MAG: hypothetical protein JWN14_4750 [Chthonomonadales bacterium]|nr:hypothetical protein [Chthonomonadales bacterium]